MFCRSYAKYKAINIQKRQLSFPISVFQSTKNWNKTFLIASSTQNDPPVIEKH